MGVGRKRVQDDSSPTPTKSGFESPPSNHSPCFCFPAFRVPAFPPGRQADSFDARGYKTNESDPDKVGVRIPPFKSLSLLLLSRLSRSCLPARPQAAGLDVRGYKTNESDPDKVGVRIPPSDFNLPSCCPADWLTGRRPIPPEADSPMLRRMREAGGR